MISEKKTKHYKLTFTTKNLKEGDPSRKTRMCKIFYSVAT